MKRDLIQNGLVSVACAMLILGGATAVHAAEVSTSKGKIVITASIDLIEAQKKILLLEEVVALLRELRIVQGLSVPSRVPEKIKTIVPLKAAPVIRVEVKQR